MTVLNSYYCDYCNTEQTSDHDEGFALTVGRNYPTGWWEVPGKGPNETTGHACPHCVIYDGAAQRDIKERRDAETLRLAGGVVEE